MWLSGIGSRKNVSELSAPRVDWYKRIIREVLEKDRMLFPNDEVFQTRGNLKGKRTKW